MQNYIKFLIQPYDRYGERITEQEMTLPVFSDINSNNIKIKTLERLGAEYGRLLGYKGIYGCYIKDLEIHTVSELCEGETK